VAESSVVAKGWRSISQEDGRELEQNVKEARRILKSLVGFGGQRNDILAHALNGLANAKVAEALGEQQRPQVFEHLFALLHESASLEVREPGLGGWGCVCCG
jgi:hypothetical protein